jgi:hypothetical protein
MQADTRFTHKSQATISVYFEMHPTIWARQGVTARKQALFNWSRLVPLSLEKEKKRFCNRFFFMAYKYVVIGCLFFKRYFSELPQRHESDIEQPPHPHEHEPLPFFRFLT